MGAIENNFPELADTIQEQRINDAILDDICRDYELLIADLGKIPSGKGNGNSGLQTDIQNSLEGLRQEILTKVQKG